MCGVLAWCGEPWERPADRAWLCAMEIIRPRGPDGSGEWMDPTGRVRLGHTRLAIQDLSAAGAQPMRSASGRFTVSYNGEIYNAPELRRELERQGATFRSTGDTEVLVEAIEAWGLETALDRIRGMFAFVCWDERERELLGAVDHVAMKPLAFAVAPRSIVLASTADAVGAIAGGSALDPTAIGQVLCLGYCPAPATMWRGISKLGPGRLLRWSQDRGVRIERWWEPPRELEPSDESFGEVFERSACGHLLSDVPLGLLLSGGLDSTAVALGARRAGSRPTCITLALAGDDESPAACETAAHLDLPHEASPLRIDDAVSLLFDAARVYDEPQGFGALLTAVAVSKAAREHAKVMLSGDGGDEALAGYTWHANALAEHDPDRWRAAYLRSVYPRFSVDDAAALLRPVESDYGEDQFLMAIRDADVPSLPWPRRAQRIDLLTFCAGSILPKMDRAAMAVGLEIRMPLLDRDVLSWALSRPVVEGEPPKAAIRGYLQGRVPMGVLSRPKQGFSLRLGGGWSWRAMLPWLRSSRLMRSGAIADGWESMLSDAQPFPDARTYALCMLAAWAEERL